MLGRSLLSHDGYKSSSVSLVLPLAGAALCLLALADVFLTVLYARSGTGLLSPLLQKAVWNLFRVVAGCRRSLRDLVLSYAGPTAMVVTAATWFLLLIVGVALIVWPALGSGIQASQGQTPTSFATAFYYSGYGLTTLGTGDIVPRTDFFRSLMVLQAFTGFSVLTLTLTYFMSVYSALVRRNVLANALHQLSGGTGDAAMIVAGLGAAGSFAGARGALTSLAMQVLDLLESHHAYPVIHYFRLRDTRYALARVTLLTMDTSSIVRTALGKDHADVATSGALQMLSGSGLALLRTVGATFLPARAEDQCGAAEDGAWHQRRFRAALSKLRQAGVTVASASDAHRNYSDQRATWAPLVRALAASSAFDWAEIEVPDIAAEETDR